MPLIITRVWVTRMGCGYRDCGDHELITDEPAAEKLGQRLACNRWAGYQQVSGKGPFCRIHRMWGDREAGVVKAQPTLHQREPRLVHRFLGAEQDPIPMQRAVGCGQLGDPGLLLG
jgi:hypothetical protein